MKRLLVLIIFMGSKVFAGANYELFTNPELKDSVCLDFAGNLKYHGEFLLRLPLVIEGSEFFSTEDRRYLIQTDGWSPTLLITPENKSFKLIGQGAKSGTCH